MDSQMRKVSMSTTPTYCASAKVRNGPAVYVEFLHVTCAALTLKRDPRDTAVGAPS